MNHPLVSVIIPVFNTEKFILETISSMMGQTYPNWECILVDDGSTDNSFTIISEQANTDPRFRVYKRPMHIPSGGNGARNFGFEKAKGDFINWFDSDDVMLENFLSEKIKLFKSGTNLVITSGYFASEDLAHRKPIELFDSKEIFKAYVMWRLKILTPSIMFRKSFLQNLELFSPAIKKGQEFEFFSRIFFSLENETYRIKNIHTFLYRSHSQSTTLQNQKYNSEFKKSEVFTLGQNLNRAIKKNDKELAQSIYRLLLNQLFKALQNDHKENVSAVKRALHESLYQKNRLLITIIEKVADLHALINLNFVRWDKVVKKIPVRI